MIRQLISRIYKYVPAGVLTVLVVGTILYLTLARAPLGDEPPALFEGADKVVHAIMFGAMSCVIALDMYMSGCKVTIARLAIIVIVTIATGIAIEIAQDAMGQGRSGDTADAIADAIGAITGIGIYHLIKPHP